MKILAVELAALTLACGLTVPARPAAAQSNPVIRIAHQFGLGYLPLYVMEDHKLIEGCAKADGAGDVTVEWTKMGSTAVLADGIISGNFTVASAGVPPFLVLWDRTRGKVKMISALNMQPMKLNTNNPAVKSISDFTPDDRIAVPATRTSTHSILLGMAAEQVWGQGNGNKLDLLQVPLSHPDATAALLAGKAQVTAHFSTIPYTAMQLADPKIHTILTSTDILGGPTTITAWWTTQQFHDGNPKLYAALLCGAEKAMTFIKSRPKEAAALYNRLETTGMTTQQVEAILSDPEVTFTTTPERTFRFADYMYRTGVLKAKPQSWKDFFFPDVQNLPGS